MALIFVNVAAVMLETVDSVAREYRTVLFWLEVGSVALFTVEYLGRIWSAVEHPDYSGPISGRIRFASRPLLIVDLLAVLPFYLVAFGLGGDLRVLRALRFLKLIRYSRSLSVFVRILEQKKTDLVVVTVVDAVLLVVASNLVYLVEHQAQPETFSSIPQTLWWGVVTLTTVGYGDMHPVTPAGQLLGGLTAVLGIGLFALPASLIASGFLEESRQRACPRCGHRPGDDLGDDTTSARFENPRQGRR
ncbi:potassium channel protein [Natrarchaeobaculum aegyptiacum]|uniref:Potassium channel protein n=2 Tax=Natrarchaeobaculum aegyptiacum TaxID=745377 RepID=A0A2Z2HWX9_9EURY|nr:potassium channel protein [Natrarchaeobaculum aegyptiacum]